MTQGPACDDLAALASLATRFLGGAPGRDRRRATPRRLATGPSRRQRLGRVLRLPGLPGHLRGPRPVAGVLRADRDRGERSRGRRDRRSCARSATRRGRGRARVRCVDVTAVPSRIEEPAGPSDVDAEPRVCRRRSGTTRRGRTCADFGSVWQAATRAPIDARTSAGSGADRAEADGEEGRREEGGREEGGRQEGRARRSRPPTTAARRYRGRRRRPSRRRRPRRRPPRRRPLRRRRSPKKAAAKKAVRRRPIHGPARHDSETTGAKPAAADAARSAKKAAAKKTPAKKAQSR